MEIKLDLDKVFEDEYGEGYRVSIADQVVQSIAKNIEKQIENSVKEKLDAEIEKLTSSLVPQKIEAIVENLLDHEFKKTDSYGRSDKPTTLRLRIIDAVEAESKYEKKDSWGNRNETAFTKVLTSTIQKECQPLMDELRKTVNHEFKKECVQAAYDALKKVLEK